MITYHRDIIQGSEEWHALRCGILTASEMKLIITPTLKIASNEKERDHLFELLAQRITKHVEPRYISDEMLRGQHDEDQALAVYRENYAPVEICGFVTREFDWGMIGYSPDALVGEKGLVEVKSRRQKFQVQAFIEHVEAKTVPADFLLQVQTGLLVTGRDWLDFISYSGGLPMAVIRAWPDEKVMGAIVEAAQGFEERLSIARQKYLSAVKNSGAVMTERRELEDMHL